MTFDEAKSAAKGMIESYLEERGINTRKPFKCLNPAHRDDNPSMSLDRERQRVKCFACNQSYDIFDLIGIDYNISSPGEQMKRAFSLFHLSVESSGSRSQRKPDTALNWDGTPEQAPPAATAHKNASSAPAQSSKPAPDVSAYLSACAARAGQTDYFERRGIPAELVQRFGLGFDPAFRKGTGGATWAAIIIPTAGDSYVARNTDRAAAQKDRYRKTGTAQLLNAGVLDGTRPVVVTEGEIDAISVIAAGGVALALGSTDNRNKLVELVKQRAALHKPTPPLVLGLDNDNAGQTATADLVANLRALNAAPVHVLNLYRDSKDANEALLKDRAALTAALEEISTPELLAELEQRKEREEYMNTSAAAHLQEFIDGISASAATPSIPTGFPALDTVLDGGLYEGLYIIGAISSLGKTTLAMQIIDQIARGGRDCLVFSLEMARSELMSKSISRLTLMAVTQNGGDTRNAKTARGITAGERYPRYNAEEVRLIQDAVRSYEEYARRIYIYEGIGDIGAEQVREIVEKHRRITGNSPVVLVDYLQILAPADVRATDKQNTDKAVLELKRLSRDYKIPVIGISSFNRDNYRAPVSMISFKESGAIEYSSDVLIGLQLEGVGGADFDVDAAKAATPRRIELKILKNRNGATGGAVLYNYYPQFNYFQEQGIIKQDAATPPAQDGEPKPIKVNTGAAREPKRKTKRDLKKKAGTALNWDGTPEVVEDVELVRIGGTND